MESAPPSSSPPTAYLLVARTLNAYPATLTAPGRLAATDWPRCTITQAVAATIAHDPAALVLIATDGITTAYGHAPGGLA